MHGSVIATQIVEGEAISAYEVRNGRQGDGRTQRTALRSPKLSGETQTPGSAFETGDHGPLRFDPGGIRYFTPAQNQAGSGRG